jgi:AcrR family transcriptional regulator
MPVYNPGRVPDQRPGPAGGARAKNREARTRAICEAAIPLLLEHGVRTATVDEITRAAGVAKGSFYRYFNDKTQLVEALFSPLAATMFAALDRCEQALQTAADGASPSVLNDAYANMAAELGMTLLSHPDLSRLYLQECRGSATGARAPIRALSDRVAQRAIELTRVAHQHGLLKPVDPSVTALAVVGAVETLLLRYLDGGDLGTIETVPQSLITMVLDGLRAD